ncbi:MAG: O-antigen export system permease [Alphaproteobacteria bacterium]|nr:O-antigen export system permease [Alphaproteobacteria bacterium]
MTRDLAGFRERSARNLRVLWATTMIELRKRYAGTFLGPVWFVLYPALFLSMYLFLYMVVFKVRFPQLGEFSYVVFIFTALVPYIAMMECATFATSVIRQNIHLIKNVMVPVDLIPARVALMSTLAQLPGMAIILLLSTIDQSLSWKALLLPVIIAAQFIFFLGISYLLAALGGLLPDLAASINIILIFLLFVSPIAFTPDMVPASARLVIDLNPVTYLIGMFREVLLEHQALSIVRLTGFTAGSMALLVASRALFNRYKAFIIDNE